jgi:tetratricopeptide (TPR) repeat protein
MTMCPTPHTFDLAKQADALRRSGRFADAAALYEQLLARTPDDAKLHDGLGRALHAACRMSQAAEAFANVTRLQPASARGWYHLGICLQATQQIPEAVAALSRAIELQAGLAEAHCALANAYYRIDQIDLSIASSRAALAIRPSFPEALNNLALGLKEKGELDEAAAHLRSALNLRPEFPQAQLNLGLVLSRQCRFEEALQQIRGAQAACPDLAEAHFYAGVALMNLGRLDEALNDFAKELARRPDWPEAHCAVGMVRLLQGDFAGGFPGYEWRLRTRERFSIHPDFAQPRWDGSPLAGRRILLHAEQGLGDTIQFVRYVPLVAKLGGTVILEAQPALMRLMSHLPGVAELVEQGQALPQFELHCPLLSLPGVMGSRLGVLPDDHRAIPAPRAYLQTDATETARWRERIASQQSGSANFNVGLAWSGNVANGRNHIRSIPFAALAPLAKIGSIQWVSLQKGMPAADAHRPLAEPRVIDWTDELSDLADTAALISALDLVVTVDTAVAHLAGALGKPVWLLLSYTPDWRWLLNRADSPWYPTMRLFRQPAVGDWQTPVAAVANALQKLSST